MSALAIPETTKVAITETSLQLDPSMTNEEWEEIGHALGRASRSSGWWIGDWINYANAKWGEKYEEAERITGLSYGYLRNCAYVAGRFDLSHRCDNLTWTHHYKAAGLKNAEEVLVAAEAEDWSVRDLVERTRSTEPPAVKVSSLKRHAAVIAAANAFLKAAAPRNAQQWDRSMTDSLGPPEARKQLTILKKAAASLAEVIEAVEYRAATPHRFMGR